MSEHFVLRLAPRALVAVVALAALVPALLVVVGSEDDANSLGGDFPSFYGAGRIVLDGAAQDLYDLVAMVRRRVEAETGVLLEPEIHFVGEFEANPAEMPDEPDGATENAGREEGMA